MKIFLINAFTDQPFTGNPAAVCFLPGPKDAEWMQKVAKEINLPTTAFIEYTNGGFSLRWFTPTTEIPLCGHGTLASAYVLWEMGYIKAEHSVSFSTKSGILTAAVKNGWIELDFPSAPDHEITAPDKLIKALGVVPKYVGKNQLDYIVEVESEDVVKNLTPDIDSIAQLPIRGVIVTSRSSSGKFDFISRFFSPAQGIIRRRSYRFSTLLFGTLLEAPIKQRRVYCLSGLVKGRNDKGQNCKQSCPIIRQGGHDFER